MQNQELQQYTAGPLNTMGMGDFNCHHPIWDKAQNVHLFTQEKLDRAQPLLNMLGQHKENGTTGIYTHPQIAQDGQLYSG